MTQEKMNRISELYRKSQAEGLTQAEKQEQAALRQEYRDSVRRSLAGQLEHTYIVDETGKHKAGGILFRKGKAGKGSVLTEPEYAGQQLPQGVDSVAEDDRKIRAAEFRQVLPAAAAGHAGLGAVLIPSAGDGDGGKLPCALGYGGTQGRAFCAGTQGVGGVFHVAAGEDPPVRTQQGGAHPEAGVGGIGMLPGSACGTEQGVLVEICHKAFLHFTETTGAQRVSALLFVKSAQISGVAFSHVKMV